MTQVKPSCYDPRGILSRIRSLCWRGLCPPTPQMHLIKPCLFVLPPCKCGIGSRYWAPQCLCVFLSADHMKRIALGLEYDGSSWLGWQSQPCQMTVQDKLEAALCAVADHPVSTICAGRTDTGVHACHQVVHFDTTAQRPLSAWVRGVNSHLPPSIAVLWAHEVPQTFHARFSARGRHYRYCLLNRPQRPGLMAGRMGWYHRPLDLSRMQAAAAHVMGTHDFSAFRAAQCQAKSPVKTLHLCDIKAHGDVIEFNFAANAFLHHMVRNLVGAIVYVGSQRMSVETFASLLTSRDRRYAPPTFPASGLYFLGPTYETHWGLPESAAKTPLGFFS